MTEGVLRAIRRAEVRALREGRDQIEPRDLLAALADEEESRAASLMTTHGLHPAAVHVAIDAPPWEASDSPTRAEGRFRSSAEIRSILERATRRARASDRTLPTGTEHLLAEILEIDSLLTARLEGAGLRTDRLLEELRNEEAEASAPLSVPADMDPLAIFSPATAVEIGRILDASSNRAREGLRVIEDYVRFALDDPMLTKRVKDLRHRLDETSRGFDHELLVGSRDTTGDVGTHIMAGDEGTRESPRAVLSANFKRATEAIRSLEEYSKLINAWIAGRFEVIRYDLYTLEKMVMTAITSHRTFDEVQLYLLVGGLPTLGDLTWIVGEALEGGVQAIQLREKGLPDREILRRAREVRILTSSAGARFVLNDRADLARLSGADAVHLGQDDMTPRDARRVLGPRAVLGVSTHDRSQIEAAVVDGAGYLGVGPVFPSFTKSFDDHVGLGFVRTAEETTTLPWFAIGGIHETNLREVIEAGARRVAVSAAIVNADRPREAASRLRRLLDEAG